MQHKEDPHAIPEALTTLSRSLAKKGHGAAGGEVLGHKVGVAGTAGAGSRVPPSILAQVRSWLAAGMTHMHHIVACPGLGAVVGGLLEAGALPPQRIVAMLGQVAPAQPTRGGSWGALVRHLHATASSQEDFAHSMGRVIVTWAGAGAYRRPCMRTYAGPPGHANVVAALRAFFTVFSPDQFGTVEIPGIGPQGSNATLAALLAGQPCSLLQAFVQAGLPLSTRVPLAGWGAAPSLLVLALGSPLEQPTVVRWLLSDMGADAFDREGGASRRSLTPAQAEQHWLHTALQHRPPVHVSHLREFFNFMLYSAEEEDVQTLMAVPCTGAPSPVAGVVAWALSALRLASPQKGRAVSAHAQHRASTWSACIRHVGDIVDALFGCGCEWAAAGGEAAQAPPRLVWPLVADLPAPAAMQGQSSSSELLRAAVAGRQAAEKLAATLRKSRSKQKPRQSPLHTPGTHTRGSQETKTAHAAGSTLSSPPPARSARARLQAGSPRRHRHTSQQRGTASPRLRLVAATGTLAVQGSTRRAPGSARQAQGGEAHHKSSAQGKVQKQRAFLAQTCRNLAQELGEAAAPGGPFDPFTMLTRMHLEACARCDCRYKPCTASAAELLPILRTLMDNDVSPPQSLLQLWVAAGRLAPGLDGWAELVCSWGRRRRVFLFWAARNPQATAPRQQKDQGAAPILQADDAPVAVEPVSPLPLSQE